MKSDSRNIYGNLSALFAFFLWGFLTIYWKILSEVPAFTLVLHRIVWCFLVMLCYTLLRGKGRNILNTLVTRKNILPLGIASILISLNWFIYVYAVSSNRILQASLGYYINPLMSIFLGLLILKEKLSFTQKISLILACIGVTIITIGSGIFPWISIGLAISFAVYGLLKKTVGIPSDIGLTIETMLLVPFVVAFLILFRIRRGPVLGALPPFETIMLILSGVVTATPLFLFAEAAKRIPLSRVGFLQFISPTIMFLVGVIMYDEPLTTVKIISFIFIWIALIIFLIPTQRPQGKGSRIDQ